MLTNVAVDSDGLNAEIENLGAGDSYLRLNVLPDELAHVAFENLRKEVKWDTMFHRGDCTITFRRNYCAHSLLTTGGEVPRLVAVEGHVDEHGK
jgi:hypothetical protein